jgi:hypothetical protein
MRARPGVFEDGADELRAQVRQRMKENARAALAMMDAWNLIGRVAYDFPGPYALDRKSNVLTLTVRIELTDEEAEAIS